MEGILTRIREEIWSRGDLAAVDELLDPDYVEHDPASPEPIRGRDGYRQLVATYRDGFPDLTFTVQEEVVAGDRAVARWTATGTHDGEIMGIPPTGAHGTVSGITFAHLRDGKVVEAWTSWDALGLLRLMGAVPEPARA
jgi:steroid delta-isomerase-like uncharacterized protein